ncbi:MAG: hypothetical protein BYD32DRAFT_26945 [Podila humilis]|nr:MAG: hypothetical protein BYD32DRAFT_26945 [Podila humilis]
MKYSKLTLFISCLVALTHGQSRSKIVTFYSEPDYQGLNYTLFDKRLNYCVNFTRGPLVTASARLFADTACALYTEQDCTVDSYRRTVLEDTPDTGMIDLFSMFCITVPKV